MDYFFEKMMGDPTKISWSQRQFMKILKSFAKGFITQLADALMSESVKFDVNGQTMTGADLKRWRDKMRERRRGVEGKSDL